MGQCAGFENVFKAVRPRTPRDKKLVTTTIYQLFRLLSEIGVGEEVRFGVYQVFKVAEDLFCVKVTLTGEELVEAGLEELKRKSVVRF